MEEKRYPSDVGKVKFNWKHYPGEDYYCDGEIEDELLEIARNYSSVEYGKIIEERANWPILYHLSPLRENIVEWLPITKKMKVLEIGSGCGAITGALANKAGEVTCIDLSAKRSMINAYRHMECDNVTIHVGNFQDIEPDLPCDYDCICLIGVFEYGQAYIQSEKPYEDFLNIIRKHLGENGYIAIAIENKFGLKYWAGCKEDHLGTYFSGLEDYPDGGVVRTFTRDGLEKIAKKCGFDEIQMYYPYPDYKFTTEVYSDKRLPLFGELSSNMRNFDRDRLQLFDEKKVFDTILKEEQFPLFANSYMMLLGAKCPIQYVKYSNDRTDAYKIKTVLIEDEDGKRIEKHPLSKEAENHIKGTEASYNKLCKRFEGGALEINQCTLKEEGDIPYLSIEYLEGVTLEQLLDQKLANDDMDGFNKLFDDYVERISYGEESGISDYDLIFANIIVQGDKWHVIDYEWTFDRELPSKELAFRAVYCYILEDEKRNKLNLDYICEKLDISQSEAETIRRQEMEFQKHVTGKRLSMDQLCEKIANPVYTLEDFCKAQQSARQDNRIQIYEDTGKGFNEEQSFFPEEKYDCEMGDGGENRKNLTVQIRGGRSALRIDPCSDYCVVYLQKLIWNGDDIPLKGKHFQTNGFKIGENTYGFATTDPNMTISLLNLKNEEPNLLQIQMEVTHVPEETIKHMQKRGLF